MARIIAARSRRAKYVEPSLTITADDATVSIPQGGTAIITVTVTPVAYNGFVAGSVTGLPSGVTGVFSNFTAPNSETLVGTLTLSATVSATPVTDDAISISVTGGTLTSNTLAGTVTVTAVVAESITVTLDDLFPTLERSDTVDLTATIARLGGYAGTVTLVTSSLPAGVTASYPSGDTLTGGTLSRVIRLTAAADATTGLDTITVTASGAGVSDATVDADLTVTAAGAAVPYLTEDFTAYATEADITAEVGVGKKFEVAEGIAAGRLILDLATTHLGNPTLRHRYATGSNVKPRIILRNTPKRHIWVRWYYKWSAGFSLVLDNGYTGGKAHKITDFSQGGFPAPGSYGRSLMAFSGNGGATSNTPGGVDNRGDLVLESYSRTADPRVFHIQDMRNAVQGGTSMFSDEMWYCFTWHWEYVSTYHHRARTWINRSDGVPTLYATHNTRGGGIAGPTTTNNLGFATTFNALSGGPIGPGIDQSLWLANITAYDGDVFSDPFGLHNGGATYTTVDFTPSIDDGTVSVVAGTSATRTITCSWGSAISDKAVTALVASNRIANLPTGMTFAIDKSMTLASPSATLTVLTTASTPPGTYPIDINLVSDQKYGVGSASHFVSLSITVT